MAGVEEITAHNHVFHIKEWTKWRTSGTTSLIITIIVYNYELHDLKRSKSRRNINAQKHTANYLEG